MSNLTPEQFKAEADFLAGAEELMKAAAADMGVGPAEDEFVDQPDDSRFEMKVDAPPVPAEEDDDDPASDPSAQWLTQPTVRNQATKFPDSVRLAEPKTVILDLSDEKKLNEFNRLQSESTRDTPELSITEIERQFYQGKWLVYVTYCKVQYMKL